MVEGRWVVGGGGGRGGWRVEQEKTPKPSHSAHVFNAVQCTVVL